MKKKPSELFEGENSSLRRTFNEATTPHQDSREQSTAILFDFWNEYQDARLLGIDRDECIEKYVSKIEALLSTYKSELRERIAELKSSEEGHSSVNGKQICVNCLGCEAETKNAALDAAIKILD